MQRKRSTAATGIALLVDEKNTATALIKGSKITVVRVKDNKDSALATIMVSPSTNISFRMQVRNGKHIFFLYSTDGKKFFPLNKQGVDGAYLPPWDRGLRAGIVAKGSLNEKAVVSSFRITNLIMQ